VPKEVSNATKVPVSHIAQTVEALPVSHQNCTGTGLNWMQQWLDKSVSQNDNNGRLAGYESPASDAFLEANSFHLSPVALANDDSGLVGVPAVFPQQSSVAEHCLQSVNLADLLLNSACTTTECAAPAVVSDTQHPVQLDSIQHSASQLPGGQITYVISFILVSVNRLLFKLSMKSEVWLEFDGNSRP